MRFRAPRTEPPEINLIPFIDVLLVILIFLMLSTTYSKFTELQITLPSADADKLKDRPQEVIVSVAADGRYVINLTHHFGRRGHRPPGRGQCDGRRPPCGPDACHLRRADRRSLNG
jgi:hypothetical protein